MPDSTLKNLIEHFSTGCPTMSPWLRSARWCGPARRCRSSCCLGRLSRRLTSGPAPMPIREPRRLRLISSGRRHRVGDGGDSGADPTPQRLYV